MRCEVELAPDQGGRSHGVPHRVAGRDTYRDRVVHRCRVGTEICGGARLGDRYRPVGGGMRVMPESNHSELRRHYEALAAALDMPNDTCFIDMRQGCHAGELIDGHACAGLECLRAGRAFTANEVE